MKEVICTRCGKVVQGYTQNHAELLLRQHLIYCDRRAEYAEKKLAEQSEDEDEDSEEEDG